MKSIKTNLTLALSICLLSVSQLSFAENLNQTDVEKFINSMQAINSTDDPEILSIKEQSAINPQNSLPIDEDGNLSIYRQVVDQAIEPASKASLEKLIKDNGFDSISQWASISDRVLAAFLNLKLQKQGAANIPELTAEMRESMPPEMLQMIEQASKMVNSVKNAPSADVSIVQDNYAQLDQLMQ